MFCLVICWNWCRRRGGGMKNWITRESAVARGGRSLRATTLSLSRVIQFPRLPNGRPTIETNHVGARLNVEMDKHLHTGTRSSSNQVEHSHGKSHVSSWWYMLVPFCMSSIYCCFWINSLKLEVKYHGSACMCWHKHTFIEHQYWTYNIIRLYTSNFTKLVKWLWEIHNVCVRSRTKNIIQQFHNHIDFTS